MTKQRSILSVLLVAGSVTLNAAQAQVYWDNYRGEKDVPVAIVPNYDNNPAAATSEQRNRLALDNLIVFSDDPGNISRTGISPNINWDSWSDALCDRNRYNTDPNVDPAACDNGEMGRIAYALLRFEKAGMYEFQMSNDDYVRLEMATIVTSQQITDYSNIYNDPTEFDYDLLMAEYQANSLTDATFVDLEDISSVTIAAPETYYAIRLYLNNAGSWNRARLAWKTPAATGFEPIPDSFFIPRATPAGIAAIPTMNAWMLIIMSVLVAGFAAVEIRRR